MYDFYFSKKQLAMIALSPMSDGQVNEVLIDGEWKKYTEMMPHGKAAEMHWEDSAFIGTASEDNIRMVDFPQEELMKLAVELRKETINKRK